MSKPKKSILSSILTVYVSPIKTALLLFLLALTIRLAVIFFWQFDGLYGQDAYAYFQQATAITKNLPQGQAPPADFFWPNGYPLLIAFFMLFVGQDAWAGQLATLLSGALLPPLAYLLSRDLFTNEFEKNNNLIIRNSSGLFAGLIIAVAGQPILSSVVIMADMPALFWATLAAWLVVRGVQFEQGGIFSPALLFLAAGAALALAIISRWLYALIVPALIFYVSFNYWRANLARQFRWQPLLAVFSGVIVLAPQLWLSLNKPAGLAHSFLLGWSPAHFWQRQFENSEGYFSYLLPMALYYAQPAGHPAYIFPILGLASLWAIWRLGQARQRGPLILLLGWAAPVYIFLAGISFQNFRFGLTLYLPLVILTDYGLNDLLGRGAGERGDRGEFTPAPPLRAEGPLWVRSPAAIKTTIILSLLGMLAWAYPMLHNFLTAQNQSKIIAAQVEHTLSPEATLITFGLTLTLQHYTRLQTLELFYLDETSLKTITESSAPLYLLLDLPSLETQWQGRKPQLNYQWFKKNTILREVGAFPPYVLFQVAPVR
jgi:4-amino-4-deoxy-L-arabinose transferase-like glycosyltransferase